MLRRRAAANRDRADRVGLMSETTAPLADPALLEWDSLTVPFKLRQWMEHAQRDVSVRIFRDVVVRVPIVKSAREEVLALLEPFGAVRYMQSLADGAAGGRGAAGGGDGEREGKTPTAAMSLAMSDELSAGENNALCHLVRFDDGFDAIRAFLQLNGAVIDPRKHHDVASELYDAVQQEAARLGDDMSEDDREVARLVADSLRPGALISNADRGNRLVVITLDFFRVAVLEGTVALPRVSLLANAKRAAKVDFTAHHAWLARMAAELDRLHPLVLSHGVEWSAFVFAVNYATFMLATPSGAPWVTVHKAFAAVGYNSQRVVAWIDRSLSETDLLTGDPNVASSSSRAGSMRRRLFPLSVPARLLLAAIALVALFLVWLRFTPML